MNQQPKIKRRIGKFEVGRTIGEGTFAKVKFARNVETGDPVALKILDKDKVLKHKLAEQIKREIATMKLIKHPNVVRLFEVMGSKTKIYIAMEFVTGGELFDKIVNNGRMRENEARKYFQQLINAVDYCHSRGVYHRDLKPENLLLDAAGNLKVSDFGLSALSQQVRDDGLFHTACGTPNYVAPEVLNDRGYDGATADLWSCGVILFVLLAGYLPFDDSNVMILYKKISSAEFTCPPWMSLEARKLICRILDPNTMTRYTVADILEDKWFKKDYKPAVFNEKEDTNLDDVEAVFTDSAEYHVTERKEEKPTAMNAFELISMSKGLNLGNLFDEGFKRETRFTSRCPANEIINKIEEAAKPLGFDVQTKNYKMKLENVKAGRKGNLNVATEVFQVAPSLHMVEVRKAKGDTLEFHKGRTGTDEEDKTMAGNRRMRKRIPQREAADYNDSNHLRKARKINGITMMNWKPSYCLEHAVTAVGSFQLGCESLRSQHRQKLRRLLKTLMLQHNWIGASGVLSVLLKGTILEKSLSRNQNKYWATLELLKKMKGDNLTPYKVQKVYDLWIKKSGSMKGRPTQGRLAVQLESMLFSLRHNNTKDTEMDAVNLKQEQGFEGNSIANFLVGLAYFQLWHSTIPEEFQLEDLNRSSTPVQSYLSESRTCTSFENSDGPQTHMSSENSVGHDAVNPDGRDLSLECHSSTSVGNEKDNVYAEHDPKICTEANVEPQNGSFQDTDCAEGSGNEKSFHADRSDDIPDASIFYTRGLPPWLLPLQLPQSTENMEEVINSHKNMLNGLYKDALMHLRAALHLEPPVFEALHPLIQMLLLGDHVMEALNELESVSHKLDTSLYIRLKASLLEYFDHGDNLQLCTHFEDILKKDPTCSHTLAKLISMHQDGVYSTEELVEMIGLHLDAVIVGDCSTWKEMACCFYKLSYCESDEISTCYTQDDEVDGPTKSNAKHDDVVIKRIPAIFTNSRTKHTWQLRCRWWITRHFSHKRLALDIASDDMELVTYKAAIATYLYGREVMYSVKATQHLTKENKMDMLAILQMHCVDASSGFFCSSLHKEI